MGGKTTDSYLLGSKFLDTITTNHEETRFEVQSIGKTTFSTLWSFLK